MTVDERQFEIDFAATKSWRTADIEIFDTLPPDVRRAMQESPVSFTARKIRDLMQENDWTPEYAAGWIAHQATKAAGHEGGTDG